MPWRDDTCRHAGTVCNIAGAQPLEDPTGVCSCQCHDTIPKWLDLGGWTVVSWNCHKQQHRHGNCDSQELCWHAVMLGLYATYYAKPCEDHSAAQLLLVAFNVGTLTAVAASVSGIMNAASHTALVGSVTGTLFTGTMTPLVTGWAGPWRLDCGVMELPLAAAMTWQP